MLKSIFVDYNPIAQVANKVFESSPFLQGMADYLNSLLFNKDDEALKKFLFLAGVAALSYKTSDLLYRSWKAWKWLPSHFIDNANLNGPALKRKYGDCWVVITGFTQGIGRGYAEIFAEFGFKLLLINRNEERCKLKAEELRQKYQGIQIKYASCDMSDKKDTQKLIAIFEEWKDLDIGIVVNNAGTVSGGSYLAINPKSLIDDINIDVLALILINRIVIPKMRVRKERSAILNISSCTGYFISPRLGVYSSAKLTLDIYSRTLNAENAGKIDVISVLPFGVTTKMMKMEKGTFMITPRECVISSLADLLAGHQATFTGFMHKVSGATMINLTEEQNFALYDEIWSKVQLQES